MRFFTHTGGTARVREFVFFEMTTPVAKPLTGVEGGKVAFAGFFEVVGPKHPEVLFAKAFKGLEF